MIGHLTWWHTGLFNTVRPVIDFDGETRASVYVLGDTPWPPALATVGPQLLDELHATTGVRFTHALVQGYADETADTTWHSDVTFDAQAILSIGAPRSLGVRRVDGSDESYVPMVDGDLVYMPPGTQDEWEHSVPAELEPRGVRLALVFRTNKGI